MAIFEKTIRNKNFDKLLRKLEDIARVLGENQNTVKSRLYRGLKKLRLELTDTWQWE